MNIMTPDASTSYPMHLTGRMQGEQSDVFAIVRNLWRRKLLIGVLATLFAVPAALVVTHLTPWYRAEVQIMVEDRRTQVLLVPDVRTNRTLQEDSVLSEVQVLLSRDLARTVIARLDLATDSEFDAPSPGLQIWPRVVRLVNAASVAASLPPLLPVPAPASRLADETQRQSDLVDGFLSRLSVSSAGHSRVIRVTFEAMRPTSAARIVNAIADEYLRSQVQLKADAAKSATDWIANRLAAVRDKTEAARIEIERSRRNGGLLQVGRDVTIGGQEAAAVSQQLVAAQGREIALKVRLESVRTAISQGRVDAIPEIVQSVTIHDLRQTEENARAKLGALQSQYGAGHPAVIQARTVLDGARRATAQETARTVRSLTDDLEREQANVAKLGSQLDGAKATAADQNERAARLVTLDRQLAANDALYTMFLDRVQQTSMQESTQQADAWVVSHADPPPLPFFPRTTTLLALAVLASTLASAGIVMVLGQPNRTFETIEHTRDALGLEVLGVIPQVRRLPRSDDQRNLYLMHDKRTPFADAIRDLHVRLGVSPTATPECVLFASTLPGEGKSTTAVAFAALMASVHRRVIVLDCDSHRPCVHTMLGVSRAPGLTNYLQDGDWRSKVRRHCHIPIDVIAAGPSVSHPANLLGSARMTQLLAALSKEYDVIVLDSPPVLAVPDALVLAPQVSRTLLLVRWGKTPEAAAERAARLILEADGGKVGAVLTVVDMKKMEMSGVRRSHRRDIERYREA